MAAAAAAVRRLALLRRQHGTMAAVCFHRPGGPEALSLGQKPVPEPAAGQVRVRVHACGVCHRDILDRRGAFPFIQPGVVPGQYARTHRETQRHARPCLCGTTVRSQAWWTLSATA
jgi:hypothetical protein